MGVLLSLKDVKKEFCLKGVTIPVLKGVSITVGSGEIIAVLGASGVGKSTLLHVIGTIERPTQGEVLYDGFDVISKSDDELARFRNENIGFVFQFHHLLNEFTALENVMMPFLINGKDFEEARGEAEKLLDSVGLSERYNHKPGELSGGEQQRVAIARALMLRPSLLLCDEPTGNLDTKTASDVQKLLLNLNREHDMTMIIVTHNKDFAFETNRVVTMVDGKI